MRTVASLARTLLPLALVVAGLAAAAADPAAPDPAASQPLALPAAPTVAPATTPATIVSPSDVDDREPATLRVMNRAIIEFRGTLYGLSPAERASAARERIELALAAGGRGVVSVVDASGHSVVQLDGKLAFVVMDADANPLLLMDRPALAKAAAVALSRAIEESHEATSSDRLMRGAAIALLATVLWGAVLSALFLVRRWVQKRVIAATAQRDLEVAVGGVRLVSAGLVRAVLARLLAVVFLALVFLATYEWLGFLLRAFPYTRPWGESLAAGLFEFVRNVLIAMADAGPGLVVVVVILFIARGLVGLSNGFFDRVRARDADLGWIDADTAPPTKRLVALLLWLFALAIAYPFLPGSGSQAFQGLSVLVGLMISLGGASSIGQAASGLILMYTRTFRVGEYVRVGTDEGTVTELGMFQTRLRTGMGDEVVLPNASIVGSVIRNYSRAAKGEGFVVDTVITIGYDAPWRQVHALLVQAALATEGVARDPGPRVFQTALADFYVEYRLVCQAEQETPLPRAEVISALHANIQDAFNAAGVQIMSPHYLGDPAEPKLVPKERWDPK